MQIYATRVDTANPTVIYIGKADPGSSELAPVWQITKIAIADVITIKYVQGSGGSFNHVWADRSSYTYN